LCRYRAGISAIARFIVIVPFLMNRIQLIKLIAKSSICKCPEIVPSMVFIRKKDGSEYSSGGALDGPSTLVQRGYCYRDSRGSYYGPKFQSVEEARRFHKYYGLRNAARLSRALKGMPSSQLKEQAEFFLGVECSVSTAGSF